jgi:hypothetical protein
MRIHQLALAALLAIGSAFAQTTGVPGINDYTINSLGSGSTSCTTMCFPNGNVTLNLSVSAPPGAFIFVFFNFCPCQTCFMGAPANACVPPIPATACGSSNQSLDFNISAACPIILSMLMGVNSAGTVGISFPIPFLPGPPCSIATLGTQAIVIDPCGAGVPPLLSGPFVLTQSYTLNF